MKAEEQAFYTQVGKFLRQSREEERMSVKEVAETVGVHESFIRNIESGRDKVSLLLFSQLTKLYGVKYINTEMIQGLK